jgi:hypothetical protein
MKSIKSAALGAAMLIGLYTPSAQAGYVVDLTQQGSDVVATGSGPIDLTGLTFSSTGTNAAGMGPEVGGPGPMNGIGTGPLSALDDQYSGSFAGPTSFGFGNFAHPNSGSGDLVILDLFARIVDVPSGYISGNPLTDTSTYDNATFASLGVTPGRYEWTWGTGPNQNFTLVIGGVPEPSTWAMMLLGFAGLGYAGMRRTSALRSA